MSAVLRMQAGLKARHSRIEKRKSRNSLTYILDLEVPCYETRRVTIVFGARHTAAGVRVFVDGPTHSRHRYEDGSLCMWHPDDPPEFKWVPDRGLTDLIEMTRRHLFREAYWRETGTWLGPEVHLDEQEKGVDR